MNKFRILNTIAFVIFCFSIGEVISLLLTCLIYDVNASQIFAALKEPVDSDRSLVMWFLCSSSLFRLLIVPGIYLLFTNKSSITSLWINSKIRPIPLLLSAIVIFSILPFILILIEINSNVALPVWLSELERFFKEGEANAQRLANFMLSFGGFKDLIIAVIIVAIIPGIVEEFFFRGLVQTQFENVLKNHHYAILVTAFLFSFFHFQFYSFIPKMVSGILFGYLFAWSKNIVYPIAAHVTNNLIIVLGAYFWGADINPEGGSFTSIILLLPSIVITVMIILYLKNILTTLPVRANINLKETEGRV